jgi:hypothetical protein
MAKFATELTNPPTGYPVGGPVGSAYYPNTGTDGTPANPSGLANSPDEPTVDAAAGTVTGPSFKNYSRKTWQAKAADMIPPGVYA